MNTSCNIHNDLSVKIFVLIFLFFFMSVHSFGQAKDSSVVPPQVEIAGTQLLKITSSICNQEYVLYINLPRGYDDTTKTFPVLFLIDAQWDFPLVQAIYGEQYYDGFIPGIVIVGITWGGKNPDYDKLRARDLTLTDNNHSGQYGNAQNFLAFIKRNSFRLSNQSTESKRMTGHSSAVPSADSLPCMLSSTNRRHLTVTFSQVLHLVGITRFSIPTIRIMQGRKKNFL